MGSDFALCDLRPDWVRDEIQIEHLEGGTTNKIVMGWCKDANDKILIRFFSINCKIDFHVYYIMSYFAIY